MLKLTSNSFSMIFFLLLTDIAVVDDDNKLSIINAADRVDMTVIIRALLFLKCTIGKLD